MESNSIGVSIAFLLDFIERFNIMNINSITTAGVCHSMVIPTTSIHECSYIDYSLKTHNISSSKIFFGKANVFVSHVWNYNFIEFIQTIHDWILTNNNTDYFFWIDVFCLPQQMNSITKPFQWWNVSFRQSIIDIGFTLIVFLPWSSPIYIKRSWCLYEFFITVDSSITYEIILPLQQKIDFIQSLGSKNFIENIFTSIFYIDIKNATSCYQIDTDNILQLVESSIGFNKLNQILLDELKKWIVKYCSEIITKISLKPKLSDKNVLILKNIGNVLCLISRAEVGAEKLMEIYKIHEKSFGDKSIYAIRALIQYVTFVLTILLDRLEESAIFLKSIDKNLTLLENETSEVSIIVQEARIAFTAAQSLMHMHHGKTITAFATLRPVVFKLFDTLGNNSFTSLDNFSKSNIAILYASFSYFNNISLESREFFVLKNAVEEMISIYGEQFPQTILLASYYASILISANRIEEGETILQRNSKKVNHYMGQDHVFSLYVKNSFVSIYIAKKEYDDAVKFLLENILFYEKFGYVELVFTKFTLGKVLTLQERYSEAEASLKETLSYAQSLKTHPWRELPIGSPFEEWFQIYVYVLKKTNQYFAAYVVAFVLSIMTSPFMHFPSSMRRLHDFRHS